MVRRLVDPAAEMAIGLVLVDDAVDREPTEKHKLTTLVCDHVHAVASRNAARSKLSARRVIESIAVMERSALHLDLWLAPQRDVRPAHEQTVQPGSSGCGGCNARFRAVLDPSRRRPGRASHGWSYERMRSLVYRAYRIGLG